MKKGFTVIETLVSLILFTIVTFATTNILMYANEVSGIISVKNELLENARITLDFISKQIRHSEGYELETDNEDSLIKLVCYKKLPHGSSDDQVFEFNKNLTSDFPRYGQVTFGGLSDSNIPYSNELASHIKDVKIKIEGNIMEIKVITKSKISESSNIEVEAIELMLKISLKHKTDDISRVIR